MKLKLSKDPYVTHQRDRSYAMACRNSSYRNGFALQTHAKSAHGGEVLSDCPACLDLKSKIAGRDKP